MMQELAPNTLDKRKEYDYVAAARGLRTLANDVSEGRVNPRRWEFLTWLQEPKVDLDSLASNAILDADPPSSGLKNSEGESESPSTKPPPLTPEVISNEHLPEWLEVEATS
jgi:hypothetical protein